jgi:hypothetical protein
MEMGAELRADHPSFYKINTILKFSLLYMQTLPDHNIPDYAQENGLYLSGKHYVRNDKMRLDRFMELANIASTNLDDQDIVMPELYEIYA